MMASLRERLESLVAAGGQATLLAVDVGFVLERGWAALEVLERRSLELPRLVVHAGCRRGSVLIEDGEVKVILDFDSSHDDARAVDLVVAVQDYAKVYGGSGVGCLQGAVGPHGRRDVPAGRPRRAALAGRRTEDRPRARPGPLAAQPPRRTPGPAGAGV
jgi:hypothetical protein